MSRAFATKHSTDASTSSDSTVALSATTATPIAALPEIVMVDFRSRLNRNRWRSPSTIGRIAARLALSERLCGM